jgi:hypothetical protein
MNGSTGKIRITGIAAIRIDFSCTWKENRKKASEELTRAKRNFDFLGFVRRLRQLGMIAVAVEARQIRAISSLVKFSLENYR